MMAPASLLEDVECDDGDEEEPDYIADDGTSLLVPPELLGSASEFFTDIGTWVEMTMLMDVCTVCRTLDPLSSSENDNEHDTSSIDSEMDTHD